MTKKPSRSEESATIFRSGVASSFMAQIRKVMKDNDVNQTGLAILLGVTRMRVSQQFLRAENLTLRTIAHLSRVLGKKVAVVLYNDDGPDNLLGPVDSEIFEACWIMAGKPRELNLDLDPRDEVIEQLRRKVFVLGIYGPQLDGSKCPRCSYPTVRGYVCANCGVDPTMEDDDEART